MNSFIYAEFYRFSQKFHKVRKAICPLIVPESTTGSALSVPINNKKWYNFKLDYDKE